MPRSLHCRGLNSLGCSDTFPQFDCHYRICQDKSEENTWELCSEEKGQDSSRPVSVFSDDRNLREWWRGRPSPHTMLWSHRETQSLIKILVHPGVAHKNCHSATWAASVVLDCRRQNLRHVRWAETALGWLLEELRSQAAHGPNTQVH